MLQQPAPFPYIGSHALLIDYDTNNGMNGLELVRILMRRLVSIEGGGHALEDVVIGFPLRDGASGNKRVAVSQLVDATPLTGPEVRELQELDRALSDRKSFRKGSKAAEQKARRDALHLRSIHANAIEPLLRDADIKAASQKRAA